MGHNRAGDRRRLRLRRRKREELRSEHQIATEAAEGQPGGITGKVLDLARGVVGKAGSLMRAAGQQVKDAVT
jgi:hypothetical protein